jgi:protoporphyrinogen IX oxidase
MPDYSLLKVLHVIAAGLVVLGILLAAATVSNPNAAARLPAALKWNRFVTMPALLAVWILGAVLVIEGHWFPSVWVPLKLVCVLGLSALHGMLSGGMKRMARGEAAPAFLRFSPYIAIALVVAILALVETKPF